MGGDVLRSLSVVLVITSACSFEMRMPVAPRFGVQLGPGFYAGNARQDGELSMTAGSSLAEPRAGEPDEPMMMTVGARYAHALDPRGMIRLYGRAAFGFEACPTDPKLAAVVGCDQDQTSVLGSDLAEVGAGVAFTSHRPSDVVDDIAAVAIGVVYREENSRERGRDDFTGVEVTIMFAGDLMTAISDASRKHD